MGAHNVSGILSLPSICANEQTFKCTSLLMNPSLEHPQLGFQYCIIDFSVCGTVLMDINIKLKRLIWREIFGSPT
jgi:hypothetical protein